MLARSKPRAATLSQYQKAAILAHTDSLTVLGLSGEEYKAAHTQAAQSHYKAMKIAERVKNERGFNLSSAIQHHKDWGDYHDNDMRSKSVIMS